MNIPDLLLLPITAAALASLTCGSVGTLTLVRRNTYVAGAVSHAVLAGLGLAQYLSIVHGMLFMTPTRGALLAAIAAALAVVALQSGRTGGHDAGLSAIWAVGMAVGIGFMSITPGYQTDLMNFLFGSILLVSAEDIRTMLLLNACIAAAFALFWRGILAVTFNAELAGLRGVHTRLYETVISLLTAVAIVLLVNMVGIVLVIALLTLPALAARCMFRRLIPSMFGAMVAAFAAMVAGIWVSWHLDVQPAAPIVLTAAMLAGAAKLTALAGRRRPAHHA